jgi:hypothetical protein
VDAPVPSEPFQLAFVTVTFGPDWDQVALQPFCSVWLPEYEYPSVQLEIGEPRFVMVIDAVNPVFHWFTLYATEQPVAALADGEAAIATALIPAAPSAAAAISTAYLRSLRNFTITTRTSMCNEQGAAHARWGRKHGQP